MKKVIVAGAGVAGLAASVRLAAAGYDSKKTACQEAKCIVLARMAMSTMSDRLL
jgi:flavin-dependent dehydrogenase